MWVEEDHMNFQLTPQACELVLYQRTELLPKKTILQKIAQRLKGKKHRYLSYKNFVQQSALNNSEEISKNYFRSMQALADTIAPHIPKSTKSILDIGCGIAGLDLLLYHRLEEPIIFLLDKTSIEEEIWYAFNDKGAFYNSLEEARSMLVSNGVPEEKILCLEATDDCAISLPDRSVDLIISTISWGFHYPVRTYIVSAERVLSKMGILILDVRKDTDGEAVLKQHFSVEPIFEAQKHTTFLARKTA